MPNQFFVRLTKISKKSFTIEFLPNLINIGLPILINIEATILKMNAKFQNRGFNIN